MARMTRPESQARTREALARTARDLFITDGLANTSLARVAEVAGYSKGAVYSNFRNKNELCLEVLELIHTDVLRDLEALRAGSNSAPELLAALASWARARIENVALTRLGVELALASRDDAQLRDQLAAKLAAVRTQLATLLAPVTANADPDLLPARTLAAFSMVTGLSVQRTVDPTISADQVGDVLPSLFTTKLKDVQLETGEPEVEKVSKRGKRTDRSDDSRAALLDTAIAVFGAKRFDEVSTTELARQAGVAIGLINYHFGGKRGVYLAAVEAVYTDFWDRLQALRGPAVSRLIQGLDLYFDHAERYQGSPLALSARATDPDLQAIHDQHFDRLIVALLQEVSGGPGTALVRTSVAGWLAFVEGAVADWLRTGDLSRVQLRELLVGNFFTTAQAVLSLDPGTPLSSRAITALFDHVQPLDDEKTEHDR
ncbi:TetR/AcrR family transcriptional regulator [Nocardia sp. NPDC058379]|uniref:TetR/AcrR family transcriptional regulator n=1 Tax=unclassified Nocardia TaxID=2637762 RepID=UPI00366526CB